MKCGYSIYVFLNSANLVCRGTDISKLFSESSLDFEITRVNCILLALREIAGCVVLFKCQTLGTIVTDLSPSFRVYENNHWEEVNPDYPTTLPRCIDRAAVCTAGNRIFFIGGLLFILCFIFVLRVKLTDGIKGYDLYGTCMQYLTKNI